MKLAPLITPNIDVRNRIENKEEGKSGKNEKVAKTSKVFR